MRIYNSLTRRIEEFIPNSDKEVTLYTCGPTVYNYQHIGNLRMYIFEDVLEKTLRYLGYNVKRAMNITDVGHNVGDVDVGKDKMFAAKEREGKTALEIAEYYTEVFKKDCEKVNIKWPDIVKNATGEVEKYIDIISRLLEKGYAYESNGNIYFDISKMPNYYELSGKNQEDLMIAKREDVDIDENKRNPFDFVLWFTSSKFKDQELQWDSPFGKGYPGWHLECSAISIKYLGEYLDIHTGGVDHIFPHHTNEIAQSEAYLGHKWCNYFMHGEFLNDLTGKMSKSKGDFLILDTLINKGYNPLEYRYYCLLSHYRNQLPFSYEMLDNATTSYRKLRNRVLSLKQEGVFNEEYFNIYQNKFKVAISDDLNTSNALTIVHNLLKDETVNDITKIKIIGDFDKVLSLDLLKRETIEEGFKKYIQQKIEERNEAKNNKNYELADKIRRELEEKGIILKDTKEGTIFELK
ncbi:MAG: cysteine--tRNA ligase [Bacilli bacterium]